MTAASGATFAELAEQITAVRAELAAIPEPPDGDKAMGAYREAEDRCDTREYEIIGELLKMQPASATDMLAMLDAVMPLDSWRRWADPETEPDHTEIMLLRCRVFIEGLGKSEGIAAVEGTVPTADNTADLEDDDPPEDDDPGGTVLDAGETDNADDEDDGTAEHDSRDAFHTPMRSGTLDSFHPTLNRQVVRGAEHLPTPGAGAGPRRRHWRARACP